MNAEIYKMKEQISEHFTSYGVVLPVESIHLEEFCAETDLTLDDAFTLLVNLEDDEIMRAIAEGEYEKFDVYNPNQFNDCYHSMMQELELPNHERPEIS